MLKKWNKKIYIAKKIDNEVDEYGNAQYQTPQAYEMNVQPISSSADIQEFGVKSSLIQRAVIEYDKYYGMFKEFDKAYLDGATPTGEVHNGDKANYRLYPPRNQNKCIIIYFEKIISK